MSPEIDPEDGALVFSLEEARKDPRWCELCGDFHEEPLECEAQHLDEADGLAMRAAGQMADQVKTEAAEEAACMIAKREEEKGQTDQSDCQRVADLRDVMIRSIGEALRNEPTRVLAAIMLLADATRRFGGSTAKACLIAEAIEPEEPQHDPRCGLETRGCHPDCTYQAKMAELDQLRGVHRVPYEDDQAQAIQETRRALAEEED